MQTLSIQHSSDSNQRLDKFLKKLFPEAPLSVFYKGLRTKKILVNGQKTPESYRLELHDEITFFFPDDVLVGWRGERRKREPLTPGRPQKKLTLLYQDTHLLVVNKHPGINVHPGDHKTKEVSLIEQVQDQFGKSTSSLTFRPSLVHRIDRNTSGCLLIALKKSTLEALLEQFHTHTIQKVYHTITLGHFTQMTGTITFPLLRKENPKNEAKVQVDPQGKKASTTYRVLATGIRDDKKISLVECTLQTGRTHQIRVHLAHMGHPILGDTSYGDKKINSYFFHHYQIERQLLHARTLTFFHPDIKKRLSIEAPYPQDFRRLLDSLTFL